MCKFYKRQYGDDFISCMPTNLYGPHDNYDLQGSHVMPAMIRKFHDAKEKGEKTVELWGSGEHSVHENRKTLLSTLPFNSFSTVCLGAYTQER